MGYGWHREGDLVRILHPCGLPTDPSIGATEDPDLGIVLRVWEPVVYQRASYDVWLRGRVMTIEHNYLLHVTADEQSPTGGLSLDPSPTGIIGEPRDYNGDSSS